MSSESRKFAASAFMLVLLVGLMAGLTTQEIPSSNRDLFVTLMSILVGAGAAAIPNLFGDQKGEVTALQERIANLETRHQTLTARYDEVKTAYDTLTAMLIDRHIVPEGHGDQVGK